MIEQAETATAPALAAVQSWLKERIWLGGWWIGGRAVVLTTALVVHAIGPRGYLKYDEHAHVLGILSAWDGRWYRMVASDGYLLVPGRQSDPAFFPLYPLLLRGGHALHLGYATAGLVISNLALLAAMLACYALTSELLGGKLARRATIYVAVFPLGYVFSMSYPESVALWVIALAGLAALRGRWKTAALCAAAAALARPEGVLVALPIAAAAWRRRRSLSATERGLALGAVVAPLAALASYPLYLARVLNDPLAWSRAEHAWGRHFTPLGFVSAFEHLPAAVGQSAWAVRDFVALLVYLSLLGLAWRAGASRSWIIAALVLVTLPVFSGTFDAIGRFGLLALPLFWGLAHLGRTRRVDVAIRGIFIALLIAATATIPFVFP